MSARRRFGGPGRLLPLRAAIEGRRSKPHDWPGADSEARAVSFRCVRRSRAGGRSRMIDALVFDFDGLILDTELPMYRAWCALFDAHGAVPPTIDEWAAEIGTLNGLDLHGLLVDRATRPVDLAEADIWRRGDRVLLLVEQQARPGVYDSS